MQVSETVLEKVHAELATHFIEPHTPRAIRGPAKTEAGWRRARIRVKVIEERMVIKYCFKLFKSSFVTNKSR